MGLTRQQWEALAEQAILGLLAEHHALIWSEVEARAAWTDREYVLPDGTRGRRYINANHLTTARRALEGRKIIRSVSRPTRGGREVEVIVPTNQTGITTAVERASRRKRILWTRFLTWATGTGTGKQRGIIGPAGEAIAHASLKEAASHVGYKLSNPRSGNTRTVAGVTLPPTMGELDNAATFYDEASEEHYALVIEVKNIRDAIYPTSAELGQLLMKAAYIANNIEGPWRVIPVIVCRRIHYQTIPMAKNLGFHVLDTRRQFLPAERFAEGSEDHQRYMEVRNELGFADLLTHTGPYTLTVQHFATTIPERADEAAWRWDYFGKRFGEVYNALRKASGGDARARILDDTIRQEEEYEGGW